MRKSLLLLAIPILAVAQIGDGEYRILMATNGANVALIREGTDAAAASKAAKDLVVTFTKVTEYWKAKNVPDAVTFAENARDASQAIVDGQGEKAANLAKLQQQCGACHRAHRGGAPGDWTFK